MKKKFNYLIFFIIMLFSLFIFKVNVKAASRVDFLVDCRYDMVDGTIFSNDTTGYQAATNSNVVHIFYSGLLKDSLYYSAYIFKNGANYMYNVRALKIDDYSNKYLKKSVDSDLSLTSFLSHYTKNNDCPKYIYLSSSGGKQFLEFTNVDKTGKRGSIYSSSKKVYYTKDQEWVYNGNNYKITLKFQDMNTTGIGLYGEYCVGSSCLGINKIELDGFDNDYSDFMKLLNFYEVDTKQELKITFDSEYKDFDVCVTSNKVNFSCSGSSIKVKFKDFSRVDECVTYESYKETYEDLYEKIDRYSDPLGMYSSYCNVADIGNEISCDTDNEILTAKHGGEEVLKYFKESKYVVLFFDDKLEEKINKNVYTDSQLTVMYGNMFNFYHQDNLDNYRYSINKFNTNYIALSDFIKEFEGEDSRACASSKAKIVEYKGRDTLNKKGEEWNKKLDILEKNRKLLEDYLDAKNISYNKIKTYAIERLQDYKKENIVTGIIIDETIENIENELSERDITYDGENVEINLKFNASSGCKSIEPLLSFLQLVLDWIRIAGIVLAVLMQIVDYMKVIFGSSDDSMVKANKHLSTRLIAVALLFLLPSLITFILALFNIQGTGDAGTCGII